MSYILEALKRSQQAREIGQVPTLDTAGVFEEDKVITARPPWSVVATALAALAVLIAIYGVLRQPTVPPVAVPLDDAGTMPSVQPLELQTRPTSALPVQGRAVPLPLEPMDHLSVGQRELIPPPQTAPAPSAEPPVATPEPLIEPPPPKGLRDAPAPFPAPPAIPLPPSRGLSEIPEEPVIHPNLSGHPQIDAEMERELQRQLQEEMAMMDKGDDQTAPPTPIPADLIADIEAFKDSVREEKGLPSDKRAQRNAPPSGDPTRLRLTASQKADLPLFVVTVHVYDADPKRRFVVLNGLKYREGETTDEGLVVEHILARGVVLRHKEHPFFVRP